MNKDKAIVVFEELMAAVGNQVEAVDLVRNSDSSEYRLRIKGSRIELGKVEDIAEAHNLSLTEENGLVLS